MAPLTALRWIDRRRAALTGVALIVVVCVQLVLLAPANWSGSLTDLLAATSTVSTGTGSESSSSDGVISPTGAEFLMHLPTDSGGTSAAGGTSAPASSDGPSPAPPSSAATPPSTATETAPPSSAGALPSAPPSAAPSAVPPPPSAEFTASYLRHVRTDSALVREDPASLAFIEAWAARQTLAHLVALPASEVCAKRFVWAMNPSSAFGNSIDVALNTIQFAWLTGRDLILRNYPKVLLETSIPNATDLRDLWRRHNCSGSVGAAELTTRRAMANVTGFACRDPAEYTDPVVVLQNFEFLTLRGVYELRGTWTRILARLPEPMRALVQRVDTAPTAFLLLFRPSSPLDAFVAHEVQRLRRAILEPTAANVLVVHVRHRGQPEAKETAFRCTSRLIQTIHAITNATASAAGASPPQQRRTVVLLASERPETIQYFANASSSPAGGPEFAVLTTDFTNAEAIIGRAGLEKLDRDGGGSRYGKPGVDGWWGPRNAWTGIADILTFAGVMSQGVDGFLGSPQSTFSEVVLGFALGLRAFHRPVMLVSNTDCIPWKNVTDRFAVHGWSNTPDDSRIESCAAENFRHAVDCWGGHGAWTYDRAAYLASPRGFLSDEVCHGNLTGPDREQELAYTWTPTPGQCELPYVHREALLDSLADARLPSTRNLTLLLVGDSMTYTLFLSMRDYLAQFFVADQDDDGGRITRAAAAAGRPPAWLSLDFVRNDYASLINESFHDASRNQQDPWTYKLRDDDPNLVLVLNRGVHYKPLETVVAELQTTLAYIRENAPSALVLIRNTPSGHPNCSQYVNMPPLAAPAPTAARMPHHWDEFAAQNDAIAAMVRGMDRVFVLDVATATALRPDSHLTPKNDCMHYCKPGPVDMWIEIILNAVLQAMRLKLMK